MPTTTADLISDVKRHLLSGQDPALNKLAADTTAGTSTLQLVYPLEGIQAGAVVQVGLELFHVWEVNDSAQTATVQAAQQGSTAADHDSGDLVVVNPRFSDFAIFEALNEDLQDLSSPLYGLYQQGTVDLTWVETAGGYDLTGITSATQLSDLYAQVGGSTSKDWRQVHNYEIAHDVDDTLFPSGTALFIRDSFDAGSVLRVQYRAAFGQLTGLTDNVVTVTGLPVSALDIPALGAAARLVRSGETRRNDPSAQGDSRRANEVPPGAIRRSGDNLWADRQRRIMAESAKLSQRNPLMSYIPGRSYLFPDPLSTAGY